MMATRGDVGGDRGSGKARYTVRPPEITGRGQAHAEAGGCHRTQDCARCVWRGWQPQRCTGTQRGGGDSGSRRGRRRQREVLCRAGNGTAAASAGVAPSIQQEAVMDNIEGDGHTGRHRVRERWVQIIACLRNVRVLHFSSYKAARHIVATSLNTVGYARERCSTAYSEEPHTHCLYHTWWHDDHVSLWADRRVPLRSAAPKEGAAEAPLPECVTSPIQEAWKQILADDVGASRARPRKAEEWSMALWAFHGTHSRQVSTLLIAYLWELIVYSVLDMHLAVHTASGHRRIWTFRTRATDRGRRFIPRSPPPDCSDCQALHYWM